MTHENKQVDEFILSSLPNTYGILVRRAEGMGKEWERPIDRRLQALRKKGRITFMRDGRMTIWSVVAGEPA